MVIVVVYCGGGVGCGSGGGSGGGCGGGGGSSGACDGGGRCWLQW